MSISTTDSTQSAAGINYAGGTDAERSTGLSVDTDTFLKLLVAQLQYQDPLEPQTDTAFVTQLAQMTSLEQMQQMNTTLSGSQAYDLIGKHVYAEVLDGKTGVTDCYLGLVNSVIVKDGECYVVIEDTAVPASAVLQVFDASAFEKETETGTDPVSEE